MENHFDLLFMLLFLCPRWNKHFDVHFRRIRPIHFPSNDRKHVVCKGKTDGMVIISRQSRHISFVIIMIKVLSLLCTLTWRVKNYVSRQAKGTVDFTDFD